MNKTIKTAKEAKEVVNKYLCDNNITNFEMGLPEIIDRYRLWQIPVIYKDNTIGTIYINYISGEINKSKSSNINVLVSRISKIDDGKIEKTNKTIKKNKKEYIISNLENTLILGKSQLALKHIDDQCVDMIFTSPPYYNAKKEYSEFDTYDDYLEMMREVIRECKRVLIDGKFFIINSSHVLIPRTKRSESSSRIAVPFDLHSIFIEEGFEFVDDIIWQKPEGAGWASGRGRRFSADRNAMQYKAVPVTEYVMVYRKKPCVLIDYFIRNHPNKEIIEDSKINGDYDKTNIWYISPAHDKRHPAIFPTELAKKVIKYYSFKNDVILDPFAGIGTTALSAIDLDRRFLMVECNKDYMDAMKKDINKKANNLFSNISYQYIDYSNEKEDNCKKINLNKDIINLKKNGITEEEIHKVLIELKKSDN